MTQRNCFDESFCFDLLIFSAFFCPYLACTYNSGKMDNPPGPRIDQPDTERDSSRKKVLPPEAVQSHPFLQPEIRTTDITCNTANKILKFKKAQKFQIIAQGKQGFPITQGGKHSLQSISR